MKKPSLPWKRFPATFSSYQNGFEFNFVFFVLQFRFEFRILESAELLDRRCQRQRFFSLLFRIQNYFGILKINWIRIKESLLRLNQIDLKHLVLETDAPYLAPVPHRGKRNESSYLINVATKLAEIYKVTVEEIANQTTENAKAIFGI